MRTLGSKKTGAQDDVIFELMARKILKKIYGLATQIELTEEI